MNYNDKKNENIEIDDMKIKSHLNASLDLSGISVSEDLINRTLEAIKKQSAEQVTEVSKTSSKEDTKKVIHWNRYIRTFAGVAAAAIVVVAGYGIINSGLTGKMSKSTNDSASKDMAYDTTATQDTTMFAADSTASTTEESVEATDEMANAADAFTAQDSATGEADVEAPQFSISADVSKADTGEGTSGSIGDTRIGVTAATLKGSESESTLTFRDIFLADPTLAEYVTITDEVNKTSITLTSQEEILDFYTVMDQQQFTYATESATASDYTIEVTGTPEAALYTMTVGNHVTVVYNGAEVSSQSLYDVIDIEALKQSLKDFYHKYSQ